MAETKTKPTTVKIEDFLESVPSTLRREDACRVMSMMEEITGEKPVMWGPSIIGFGTYHYTYESGHEGDACIAGFSPRKANLVIYLTSGFADKNELVEKLGKHKASKSCLYINKLSDIDLSVLEQLVRHDVAEVRRQYPE